MLTPEQVIDVLGLKPLRPEGGYYRETYRSDETIMEGVLPKRYERSRVFGAAIYFMLTPGTYSAMHRIATDEVYHFYLGDPVELLELHPDGSSRVVRLGHNILNNMVIQHVVRRGVWQGSRLAPGGRLAVLGTTTAPGFDQADYEHGQRAVLMAEYPHARDLIDTLTETPKGEEDGT